MEFKRNSVLLQPLPYLTPSHSCKRSGVVKKGKEALHIEKCLLTLCYLVTLNVGNSITQIKDIAEVDTTGGYNMLLVSVPRVGLPSRTLYGYIYTSGVGVKVCLYL